MFKHLRGERSYVIYPKKRVFLIVLINWASEASPTLGCSIEISGDIYIYMLVGRYVCRVPKCVGGITCAHAQSHFWAVKTDL